MIATDRFVFLHLHKSGGTFANQWLMDHFAGARRIGYHFPRAQVPADLRHLPVLGLVRNPWSYYVSWYSFQSGKRQANRLFRFLSDDGTLGFEPTIRRMAELGSGGNDLDELLAELPEEYGNRGLNLPADKLADIRGSGLGFYGFLYRYMYDGSPPVVVVKMEAMREALPGAIEALGADVSDEARAAIAHMPPARESRHGPYIEYYGEALRDLVGARDAPIIERYGYRFGE